MSSEEEREENLQVGAYIAAKDQLLADAFREEVVIVCPHCQNDVPTWELAHFVRFYNEDEGYTECPTCGQHIVWRMLVLPRA